MNMLELLGIILVLLITIPIVVYLSAKMGSYGYLRGKQLFTDQEKADESSRSGQA